MGGRRTLWRRRIFFPYRMVGNLTIEPRLDIPGAAAAKPGATSAADYLFRRMAPEVVTSFTATQVRAIREAFSATPHVVDIRETLNVLGHRFYLVFQVGRERRSAARLKAERKQRHYLTAGNVITLAVFALFLVFSVIGASAFLLTALGLR
jgi:hypothetical protein